VGDRAVALRKDAPRNWWRTAAFFVGVAGAVACAGWFAYALQDQSRHVDSFIDLPPQSGFTVDVPEPGVYTIWASAISGGYIETPPVAELQELLVVSFDGPVDSDDPVHLDPVPFDGGTRYRVDGQRFGVAVWTVDFAAAGTYDVERRNLGTGGVKLSLGEGVGMPSRITAGLMLIGGITVVLVVALLVIGSLRQRRRINEMMSGFDSYRRD
jgi:hypothetical protein